MKSIILRIFLGTMGCISLLMSIGTFLAPNLYTFECRRLEPLTNQGKCELKSQGILGSESLFMSIESLQNAKVDELVSYDDDFGTSRTYRVVIVTTEGNFPLTRVYTGGLNEENKKRKMVKEIRAFINNQNKESLSIEENQSLIMNVGIIFGVFGIIEILVAVYLPSFSKKKQNI